MRRFDRFFAREANNPDLGRGLRCMVSFMAPLALGVSGWLPVNMIFAAIAAQNVANVDVRGAYGLRLVLLLAMTVILAGASALGALAAHPLALCFAATTLIALGAGLWRHLSSDYGPSLATATALLCYIAMAERAGAGPAANHAIAALVGGCWGAAVQTALWPIRPQHPLRVAVADSWIAAAAACTPKADAGAEAALRSALNKAYAVLESAGARRRRPIVERLENLNRAAARFAQRVSAFQSAYEELAGDPARGEVDPAVEAAFTVIGNLCRTAALGVVSRQPQHVAAAEVRARRIRNLVGVLRERLPSLPNPQNWATVAAAAGQIEEYAATVAAALRDTVARASDQGAFSLELADLTQSRLRPLAASLNLSRRVDPALVRYTGRILALTLIGVWAMKAFRLPHGYWLPFTMVVVLQPDYGSTRTKAAQRLLGTLAGSVLASLVLWLRLPFPVLMAATAATAFVFGFFLRRSYGIAVVFITLFVVVLTESLGPATLALTIERVGDTLVGGLLALVAALIFWPAWERDRFRPILARALRANAAYLRVAGERLAQGRVYDADVARAKRAAESAVAAAFSSLQRMSGDPEGFRERMNALAAVANANQRVTRALNLVVLQAHPAAPASAAQDLAEHRARALEAAADAIERGAGATGALARAREELNFRLGPGELPAGAAAPTIGLAQLARASAEIGGIVLGAGELANPPASAS